MNIRHLILKQAFTDPADTALGDVKKRLDSYTAGKDITNTADADLAGAAAAIEGNRTKAEATRGTQSIAPKGRPSPQDTTFSKYIGRIDKYFQDRTRSINRQFQAATQKTDQQFAQTFNRPLQDGRTQSANAAIRSGKNLNVTNRSGNQLGGTGFLGDPLNAAKQQLQKTIQEKVRDDVATRSSTGNLSVRKPQAGPGLLDSLNRGSSGKPTQSSPIVTQPTSSTPEAVRVAARMSGPKTLPKQPQAKPPAPAASKSPQDSPKKKKGTP